MTKKKIKIVNCGIYYFKVLDLLDLIPLINNNNISKEYYLTDIIQLMISYKKRLNYVILNKDNQYEITNINTKNDLDNLNNFINNIL